MDMGNESLVEVASDWLRVIHILYIYIYYMVGGVEHVLCFHILGIIIPTDYFF